MPDRRRRRDQLGNTRANGAKQPLREDECIVADENTRYLEEGRIVRQGVEEFEPLHSSVELGVYRTQGVDRVIFANRSRASR